MQAPLSVANKEYAMRNERFELVDLRFGDYGSGGEDIACALVADGDGVLRTGIHAERPCHCNESLGYVNCRGRARRRRRRRLRDETPPHLEPS